VLPLLPPPACSVSRSRSSAARGGGSGSLPVAATCISANARSNSSMYASLARWPAAAVRSHGGGPPAAPRAAAVGAPAADADADGAGARPPAAPAAATAGRARGAGRPNRLQERSGARHAWRVPKQHSERVDNESSEAQAGANGRRRDRRSRQIAGALAKLHARCMTQTPMARCDSCAHAWSARARRTCRTRNAVGPVRSSAACRHRRHERRRRLHHRYCPETNAP
jgi:hypothetical protein